MGFRWFYIFGVTEGLSALCRKGGHLMIQHKFLGSGVEAQIQHRRKGKQISNRKYQIQRKHIAKNAVNYRR